MTAVDQASMEAGSTRVDLTLMVYVDDDLLSSTSILLDRDLDPTDRARTATQLVDEALRDQPPCAVTLTVLVRGDGVQGVARGRLNWSGGRDGWVASIADMLVDAYADQRDLAAL